MILPKGNVPLFLIIRMLARRLFFIIISLMLVTPATNASISDNKIRKLISKYDLADTVLCASSPRQFWELLLATNPRYAKTASSIAGKRDRDLKRDLARVVSNAREFFINVAPVSGTSDLTSHIDKSLQISSIFPTYCISVTPENDYSFYSYPNGYVFLTEQLYRMAESDTLGLTALTAAESAHFVLQHAYAHAKWEKSQRRKQNFAKAMLGIGVAAAFGTAAAATHNEDDAEVLVTTGAALGTAVIAANSYPRYLSDYTPDQIIEADIIAFRFMESFYGSGNLYIEALRRYGFAMDTAGNLTADHFPVSDRIRLLEYLRDAPDCRISVKDRYRLPSEVGVDPKVLKAITFIQ